MEREVIHLNVSNFMASVEEVCDRSLRGRPVVIAAIGLSRSPVIDISDTAFREGLRRGMPLSSAVKRAKGAAVLAPRLDVYEKAERAMYEIASLYSPIVEQSFRGHIFIDVTGSRSLLGSPLDLAAKIKREFQERLRLDPSTALSSNKLVSKVASRLVKPRGFASVPQGAERSFLHNQSVSLLPGIGEKLYDRLLSLGVERAGDLAALAEGDIIAALGSKGLKLREFALGIDPTPVINGFSNNRELSFVKSVTPDSNDRKELLARLFLLSEEAGFLIRGQNLSAKSVRVELLYSDMVEESRRGHFQEALFSDGAIFKAAAELFYKAFVRRIRVKRIGLILGSLCYPSFQLELFEPPEERRRSSLQRAVDAIRSKYGREAIGFAFAESRLEGISGL